MVKKKNILLLIAFGMLSINGWAQFPAPAGVGKVPRELRYNFNESGNHYVKFTFLNQVWLRFNESNPGTTVFGTPKDNTFDIGLRRTRIQLFGQVLDKVFFYTQFGQNNLNKISPRKQGLFFLDAIGEYKVADGQLSFGAGLTGWSGLSRYASPSVGSILTLDAPLYQQATNDINDQFLRKLSVYAKGKLGKLDYRLAVSDPLPIETSSAQAAILTENALFATGPAKPQAQGYFMYQFLDQESNVTPYNAGTYLGKKEVFNIGAGFLAQQDAMWYLGANGTDTVRSNMVLFAVDMFYDAPINLEKGTSITAYASFSSNDYGKNYVRNIGAMNPANGTTAEAAFNGAGSAFPIIGTGNTFYAQLGYLLKNDLLGGNSNLQPFAAMQLSQFKLFEDQMLMYEGGANWLIDGHRSKLSLMYQGRPVFTQGNDGLYRSTARKGMVVMQFQLSI